MYIDTVYGFNGYSFLCLVGCFTMIIWTPIVLSVLYACVSYFCICTCSAQLSMFHMEKRSRNTLIIIIIIITSRAHQCLAQVGVMLYHICLFVYCPSNNCASVSQGRTCSDNFTCCHTETEVADQTFHLTQSQYTDTGHTSLSTDLISPGAWQGSHRSANV